MALSDVGANWYGFGAQQPPLMDGRNTLGLAIARQIEDLIVERHLSPGDRLPSERELTRLYGMSRTVVRDALTMLAQRGLLRIMPGKGIFVSHTSTHVIRDSLSLLLRREGASPYELMQARQILEENTAWLAARAATPADLEALRGSIAAMRGGQHDPRRYVRADVAFHEALAQAGGNRVLLSFLLSLRDLLQERMLGGTAVPGTIERNLAEHEAVLAAVLARDGAAARQAMHEHLDHTYTEWLRVDTAPVGGDQAQELIGTTAE